MATPRSTENSSIASPLARCIQRSACRLYVTDKMAGHYPELMFCKLAASNSFERTLQSAARTLLSTSALALAKQSDEETSDRLDGQDASCPLSVDGEAVPGGEQAPAQGRPPRRSDPDLSAVRAREGDLSDRLHQQDDRGTGVPSVQAPW